MPSPADIGTPATGDYITFNPSQKVGLIKLQSNEEANTCYAGEILLVDINVKQGEVSQLGELSDALAMPVLATKKEFDKILVSSKTTVLNGLFEKHPDFIVPDTGMEVRVFIEIELFDENEEIKTETQHEE